MQMLFQAIQDTSQNDFQRSSDDIVSFNCALCDAKESLESIPLFEDFDRSNSRAISQFLRDIYKRSHQIQYLQRCGLVPSLRIERTASSRQYDGVEYPMFHVSLSQHDLSDSLRKYLAINEELLQDVIACRSKDNERGSSIILDYPTTNSYMREGSDGVVRHIQSKVESIKLVLGRFGI